MSGYDSKNTTIQRTNTYLQVVAGIAGDKPSAPKDPVKSQRSYPWRRRSEDPSQDAQFPECKDHSAHPLLAPLLYSLEAFHQCTCAVWAPGHVAGFFPYVTEFPALVPLYSVIYYLNFASSIPFMFLTNIFLQSQSLYLDLKYFSCVYDTH